MAEQGNSPDESAAKGRAALTADLLRFALVGLFFLGGTLLLHHALSGNAHQQIQELRANLQGATLTGGIWASGALFVLIAAGVIILGVPRLWVCGVAGAVYGVSLGVVLALISSLVGATTVYWLGRSLLAGVVQRRFVGRLALWGELFRRNAFWWVLYSRLIPFTNTMINSLLCGCCRVPLGPYLAGSFLGFIPLTLVFVAFGSGGAKGNAWQVVLGLALLLLAFLCRLLVKRFFPQKDAETAPQSEAGSAPGP